MRLEHRKHIRYRFGTRIYNDHGKMLGIARDISMDGCFIETRENLNMYDSLNVSFVLPGTFETIKGQCQIMRRDQWGIGTMFVFNKKERRSMFNFIRTLSRKSKNKQDLNGLSKTKRVRPPLKTFKTLDTTKKVA